MRGSGHHATGIISGFMAMSLCVKQAELPLIYSISAIPFSWWGSVFPDTSEFFMGVRWVRHRTVTHWVPLWILLFTFSFLHQPLYPLSQAIQACAIGFTLGGLTHLLFDWPNPRGVPFLTPWRHHSLKLWNSGRREVLIVLGWGMVACLFWVSEISYLLHKLL
jgi:membrane-bound metal-dependent hydrolase YbcI (DUF457 family)